jgi:hypothetical protein
MRLNGISTEDNAMRKRQEMGDTKQVFCNPEEILVSGCWVPATDEQCPFDAGEGQCSLNRLVKAGSSFIPHDCPLRQRQAICVALHPDKR